MYFFATDIQLSLESKLAEFPVVKILFKVPITKRLILAPSNCFSFQIFRDFLKKGTWVADVAPNKIDKISGSNK